MQSTTVDHRAKRLYEEHPGSYSLYTRGATAWVCRYVGSNGKTRFVTLKTKRSNRTLNIEAARAECEALAGAKRAGEDIAPSDMRFNDLAEQCFAAFEMKVQAGQRSGRSLENYRARYRTHIEPRFGHVKAQSITRAQVLRFHDELLSTCGSTSNAAAVWKCLKKIVNFGVERGLISLNASVPKGEGIVVENKRRVLVLTPEQARIVVEKTQKEWRMLIEAVRLTGARVSELLGVQVKDMDFATGTLTISKQLNRHGQLVAPKTRNGVRTIHVPESLRVQLLAHYNGLEGKAPEAFLFGQHTAPRGRYRLVQRAFAKALRDSGIKYDSKTERVSLHSFRHGVATTLIGKGVDPQTVAEHLGDDIATVLATYVHSNGNAASVASILEEAAA